MSGGDALATSVVLSRFGAYHGSLARLLGASRYFLTRKSLTALLGVYGFEETAFHPPSYKVTMRCSLFTS
jgi:hypothetical protein